MSEDSKNEILSRNGRRRAESFLTEVRQYECPYCGDHGWIYDVLDCIKKCRSKKARDLRNQRAERRLGVTSMYLLDNVTKLSEIKDRLIEGAALYYKLNVRIEKWDIQINWSKPHSGFSPEVIIKAKGYLGKDGWGRFSNFFLPVGRVGWGFQGFTKHPTIWSDGLFDGNLVINISEWPHLNRKMTKYVEYLAALAEDRDSTIELARQHVGRLDATIASDPEMIELVAEQVSLESRLADTRKRIRDLTSAIRAAYPKIEFPPEPILPTQTELLEDITGF